MGKFYELFHMDSTIGVKELGLIYMKVIKKLEKHYEFLCDHDSPHSLWLVPLMNWLEVAHNVDTVWNVAGTHFRGSTHTLGSLKLPMAVTPSSWYRRDTRWPGWSRQKLRRWWARECKAVSVTGFEMWQIWFCHFEACGGQGVALWSRLGKSLVGWWFTRKNSGVHLCRWWWVKLVPEVYSMWRWFLPKSCLSQLWNVMHITFTVGRLATKNDRVVKREICCIQSKGTKRYSFIDGDATESTSAYLLAICERVATASVL